MMRWLFIDPTNRQEAAYRAEKLKAIDAWWREFRQQADALAGLFAGKADWDLPGWMQHWLAAVDARLMWEYGPAVAGEGHRLVITPEAEHWLRPLLETLLERGPDIPGWEFYGYRLPMPMETAVEAVKARGGSDVSQAEVSVALGEANKVDLTFCLPQCSDPLDVAARTAAFVATESLAGEELLDRWIGEIGVAPMPRRGLFSALRRADSGVDPKQLIPLGRLKPRVEQAIEQLQAALPAEPSYALIHDTQWTSYEFKPRRQAGHSGRDDLLVAISGRGDVFEAAHGGGLFHSECFSRHGETFCYLKIDAAEGPAGSRFEDRAAIEDALNEALVPARLGCVIGGGTGERYSYIDLALMNLTTARQAVRDVLLEGGVPQRTWLLFFDAALCREWVGIHDDTPPPGVE